MLKASSPKLQKIYFITQTLWYLGMQIVLVSWAGLKNSLSFLPLRQYIEGEWNLLFFLNM